MEDGKFSEKSDVWAFGIVIYEVFMHGATPYHGMTNAQVFRRVCSGYRLERPQHTPDSVYNLMLELWSWNDKRPLFRDVLPRIQVLYDAEAAIEPEASECGDGEVFSTLDSVGSQHFSQSSPIPDHWRTPEGRRSRTESMSKNTSSPKSFSRTASISRTASVSQPPTSKGISRSASVSQANSPAMARSLSRSACSPTQPQQNQPPKALARTPSNAQASVQQNQPPKALARTPSNAQARSPVLTRASTKSIEAPAYEVPSEQGAHYVEFTGEEPVEQENEVYDGDCRRPSDSKDSSSLESGTDSLGRRFREILL
jgi:serine/threonine protein kinase